MTNKISSFLVALLFLAVITVSVVGTDWAAVDELPQNLDDPSNIEGIGELIFTGFVVPFEVLSLVLLASLIGAVYIAKGEDS